MSLLWCLLLVVLYHHGVTNLAAAGEAGSFAGPALAGSPAGLVGPAEPAAAVAAAAERPAGLPAPQYGSPPLPWTATVCFPIAGASGRRKSGRKAPFASMSNELL